MRQIYSHVFEHIDVMSIEEEEEAFVGRDSKDRFPIAV